MNSIDSDRTSDNTYDAIVAGAGVIGLAIAWELNSQGASVLVVDRDRPGAGTTSVAAGMLAPTGELDFGEPALLEMNTISAGMYPEFVASVERVCGGMLGYQRVGGLHVALDRDEAAELRRVHDLQIESGLRADWLGPGAARELEQGVSPTLTGAVLIEDDGAIDPRVLTAGLLEALEKESVEVRVGTEVTAVRHRHGQVDAVEFKNGDRINTRAFVAAVGAESGRAEWIPDEARPPVRPVKGQIIELKGNPAEPICQRILASERVYLVPRRDGRLIVGATVEERGFDSEVTAGGLHELLREAYRLLPDVSELAFLNAVAGLRPGTPDNLPVVGPTSIDGFFLATGHYRNGILLAPITARAIADVVSGGEICGPMSAASPARFDPARTGASR
ncbi:MAG: glycine oxidase ThiO [Solirubrobacterales bacterium]|nr:glycine oxidase ThiO [Solirubrobacterales bacterium]